MIETAAATFITSLVAFAVFALFIRLERLRGRRMCMVTVRASADVWLASMYNSWQALWHDFTKYVVRLGWYYSVHSFLRFVLSLLVSVYTYFEHKFESNRLKTKELRKEKKTRIKRTHLSEIAEHKTQVSLSSDEQETLLKQKLEQDH